MSSARDVCRETIKSMVPADLWGRNHAFTEELHQLIRRHRLMTHPLLKALDSSEANPAGLIRMHLEFRYTFAQIFTDSLIHAMYQAQTLEPRFGAIGKVSARFMLLFNVLDEHGFEPAKTGEYEGSPVKAHYVQFEKTMSELGITRQQINDYQPSPAALAVRRMIEASYGDYPLLLTMLAVAETVFDSFASVWAKNVAERTRVDVKSGYHAIHTQHAGGSLDDVHSDDLWYVLCQGLEPSRYADLRSKVSEYLDALARLTDHLASA